MRRRTFRDLVRLNEMSPEDQHDEHSKALRDTGFWGKAGAGAIFMARDTGRILIAHRSPDVQEGNTWGVWGGAIDQGESPLQAAHREAQEEAGINVKGNDIIPLYVFKHPSGFQYHNFLILVDHEFAPRSTAGAAWETQGFKWVEFGHWPKPLHFGLAHLINDEHSRKILFELSLKFSLDSNRKNT